jgi:hypothetical protein
MNSDEARQRAEESFKHEGPGQDAEKVAPKYEAQAVAIRKKTEHLKALRLAKEAQAENSRSNE